MSYKILLVCVAAVVTLARPDGPAQTYGTPGPIHPVSLNTVPNYNFDYAVKDYIGNDFGHQESRNGYDTQGSFYVQLPDSRLQKVTYTVSGDSGFLAEVNYQGEAQYPAHTSYQPASGYA